MAVTLVASLAASGTASAGTNLLGNGSFEWPRLTGATVSRSYRAGQHIGAWTVTAGPVYVTTAIPPYETPPVGLQLVQLRPAPDVADGEICQTVSGMNPSAMYKIRFLAASILGDSTVDVTLDGVNVGHADLAQSAFPPVFALHEWRVRAPATSATLCLHGHPVSTTGFPLVDAVRMKPAVG